MDPRVPKEAKPHTARAGPRRSLAASQGVRSRRPWLQHQVELEREGSRFCPVRWAYAYCTANRSLGGLDTRRSEAPNVAGFSATDGSGGASGVVGVVALGGASAASGGALGATTGCSDNSPPDVRRIADTTPTTTSSATPNAARRLRTGHLAPYAPCPRTGYATCRATAAGRTLPRWRLSNFEDRVQHFLARRDRRLPDRGQLPPQRFVRAELRQPSVRDPDEPRAAPGGRTRNRRGAPAAVRRRGDAAPENAEEIAHMYRQERPSQRL